MRVSEPDQIQIRESEGGIEGGIHSLVCSWTQGQTAPRKMKKTCTETTSGVTLSNLLTHRNRR